MIYSKAFHIPLMISQRIGCRVTGLVIETGPCLSDLIKGTPYRITAN